MFIMELGLISLTSSKCIFLTPYRTTLYCKFLLLGLVGFSFLASPEEHPTAIHTHLHEYLDPTPLRDSHSLRFGVFFRGSHGPEEMVDESRSMSNYQGSGMASRSDYNEPVSGS